jgi:hypothetical protein
LGRAASRVIFALSVGPRRRRLEHLASTAIELARPSFDHVLRGRPNASPVIVATAPGLRPPPPQRPRAVAEPSTPSCGNCSTKRGRCTLTAEVGVGIFWGAGVVLVPAPAASCGETTHVGDTPPSLPTGVRANPIARGGFGRPSAIRAGGPLGVSRPRLCLALSLGYALPYVFARGIWPMRCGFG